MKGTRIIWRVVAVLLIGAMLMISPTIAGDKAIAEAQGEVVTFPDPNLEAAIREAIDKPEGDIYQSDLERLTHLLASFKDISNLTGMEHCTSLTLLQLGDNQISDIGPLVQNEGLGEGDGIDIRGNPLSEDSLNTYIPQLEERGVNVLYDIPPAPPQYPVLSWWLTTL